MSDRSRRRRRLGIASLPLDLLLEIFRHLESTAIIRCAAACRPCLRAIIGNALFLLPHPDRFLPRLLLGVFHGYGYLIGQEVCLRRTAGPLQSAIPLTIDTGYRETAKSFIPAAAAAIAGRSQQEYGEVLSSRDGFILLRGRHDLCLCNPMTRDCALFAPKATIESDHDDGLCMYVLLTGYDLSLSTSGSTSDNKLAVRILAVPWDALYTKEFTKENIIKYQLFSFTSRGGGGARVWGPIRHSVELQQGFWVRSHGMVVYRDVVHWFGGPTEDKVLLTWTVSLDVHTGRTWITELPEKTNTRDTSSIHMATTSDGRLSLIRSLSGHKIQLWVLNGGDRWAMQQTVDVQKQLPHCREDYFTHTHTYLRAFCPRSGCVLAIFAGQEIRIDLESSPCSHVTWIGNYKTGHCIPYEMDWSTYISKMKLF